MGQLFGTNGVRGIIGDTMTPDLAMRLGKAVGTWLQVDDVIVIGTDARQSREMISAAFAAGVQSTGVDVVHTGVLPSPSLQLYVRNRGFSAGAVITASHNPPEWNGIKLIAPDGTEASPDEEAAVERIFCDESWRQVDWQEVGTASHDFGAIEHHLDAVLAQVDVAAIRAANLHVVLDPGGGAGCVATPDLLERLGVETIPLHCTLDGTFSGRPSEPTPANAKACMDAVRRHGADMGVLQDGDADRAVFIDEQGDYIWGDAALALIAKHELARHPRGAVVCTGLSTGTCLADVVQEAGGTLATTVVGSPLVAREMMRRDAVFGGEDNGGLMFARHQFCRDGLMATAFMLELIATTQRTLSSLVAEMPRYELVKQTLPVPVEARQAVLAGIRELVAEQADVRDIDDRDGVKAQLDDGWVLIRPSGTEPIFRIQGEAKTEATAQALVARFRELLETAMSPIPA